MCLKYRIIITIIIIISLGQILQYRIFQTNTHARTHARTHTHASTHARTHARTHAHTHACTHADAHARQHARTHTHTHERAHTHTHTHCSHNYTLQTHGPRNNSLTNFFSSRFYLLLFAVLTAVVAVFRHICYYVGGQCSAIHRSRHIHYLEC